MKTPLRVLIVEDNAADVQLLLGELRAAGFEPNWSRAETETEFRAEIGKLPELILSDYALPGFDGLSAARILQEIGLDIPFILVSGTLGEDIAVTAMRNGVTDYLLKDPHGPAGRSGGPGAGPDAIAPGAKAGGIGVATVSHPDRPVQRRD